MNMIFIGPPGSGKGSQSERVSKLLNIETISTGNLIRDEIKKNNSLSIKLLDITSKGELVSDELVMEILENKIKETSFEKGFLLDGYPRNLNQAKLVDNFFVTNGKKINFVFNFLIDKQIILNRILGRFSCKICKTIYNKYYKLPQIDGECDVCHSKDSFEYRSDDNKDTTIKRIDLYYELSENLLKHYRNKGILYDINADKDFDLVTQSIMNIVNS